MSLIQRKYYVWDNQLFNLEYDLGTDISRLIKTPNLVQVVNEESNEIEFKGLNGNPHRITLKNNKIDSVWFSNRSELPNNSLFKLPINELLERLDIRLKSLNHEICTQEDLKEYDKSNVLFLIFRDYHISYIGVLKKHK